jgi:hypothetical protein
MSETTTLMQFLRDNLLEYEISRYGTILIVRNSKIRMVHNFDIVEMSYIKGELTKENLNEIILK